jgi:hypothetical protein
VKPPFAGGVRQFAYVVNDLDATLTAWVELGVGPWFVLDSFRVAGADYRGERHEPLITMAFANTGDMQIEVISQHDDTPSVWKEFLDSGREGFHHVAYWSRDYPSEMARAAELGWQVVQLGPQPFAYLECGKSLHAIVEVMALSDRLEGYTDAIRRAAADWDGTSDPVRSYPPAHSP